MKYYTTKSITHVQYSDDINYDVDDEYFIRPSMLALLGNIDRDELFDKVRCLVDEKEWKMIEMRLIEGKTYKEIGEHYGYSDNWTGQLYKKILEKIKKGMFKENI